jgi:5'-nucleotidase
VLSANIFKKGTRERPEWARPTALVDVSGLKVGIIGLTTVETPIVTQPANVAELEFAPGGPIAAELADALRAQGAQVVLVTAHMGRKADGEIKKVAEACRGKVDAIVSGHHHEPIGPPPFVVAGIPIVQSGAKLQAFSVIELALDGAGKPTGFAVNANSLPQAEGPMAILHSVDGKPVAYLGRTIQPDAKVAAIIGDYDAQVRKLRESKIGETQILLRKGGKDDLLANLAADALRSGAGGGVRSQYAFQNSGGLRIAEIAAGPITYGQIFDLYPFDNQQVVVTLPAVAVRNALEAVLHAGKGPLKVSGLRYTIDWNRFHAGKDAKDAPPGAIVTEVVDEATGKPLCETKSCTATECVAECAPGEYRVSVTDFLANGGDGLSLLRTAKREAGPVLARDIIVAYVKQHAPLTAQVLGSVAAGRQVRVTQVGSARGQEE